MYAAQRDSSGSHYTKNGTSMPCDEGYLGLTNMAVVGFSFPTIDQLYAVCH